VKKNILDKTLATLKLERMALEIAERNTDATHIVLAGIRESGSVIAAKLLPLLQNTFDGRLSVVKVSLDKKNPDDVVIDTDLDFNDKVVIIVDDVANSGKTMTYALKPFLVYHPQKIQTLVLVERTHKTFPISADYVGLSVATTLQEHIFVESANDEIMGAYLQ